MNTEKKRDTKKMNMYSSDLQLSLFSTKHCDETILLQAVTRAQFPNPIKANNWIGNLRNKADPQSMMINWIPRLLL